MKNILTYVKNENKSFAQSPLNAVDALVLCWLAYFSFPEYLSGGESVALKDMPIRGLLPEYEMYAEAYKPKTSKRFFKFLTESPRFKDVELCDFKREKSEAEEKQFAAVCLNLGCNQYFLAFRGTDPSFMGWKEDFNLICRYPVPSQRTASEYLSDQMRKFPQGRFFAGGHSKGGNIAMYAAVTAEVGLQDRLINVFNFDGPGFIDDIYSYEGYSRVEKKIVKIIPKSSFVGALLETRNCYSIIKSFTFGVLQHDPFTWTVKGTDFIYAKKRTHGSVRLERAVNKWIYELSFEERERVINLVYAALNTLDTKDFNVFFKTFYRQIPALYKEYRRLNAEDKSFFNLTVKRLQKLLVNK